VLLALWFACPSPDTPVVRGVEEPVAPATAEAVAARREQEEIRASPRTLEVNYAKPPGVYVDVQFLGGRKLDNVAHILVEQLGQLNARSDVVEGKHEERYERGTLTLVDDVIVVLDVPLPEPSRRTEAMAALGFNPLVDQYLSFSREFRVTQYMDFRRIILHRQEPNSEFIVRVTAYKRQLGANGKVLED
jgi:hypothetical protein